MKDLLNFGQMLSVHSRVTPNRVGARDLERSMTFSQWNERSCRLANALLGLGLNKGDRVAVLAYNCVEWCEIFAATAKAGLVALPINFRLIGKEVQFIVDNAEASAFIVQDELAGVVEEIRKDISDQGGPLHPFRYAAPVRPATAPMRIFSRPAAPASRRRTSPCRTRGR